MIALVCSLIGTPMVIQFLARKGYGQEIREDGPQSHQVKRGTPTMGGTVIVIATLLAYFVTKLLTEKWPTTRRMLVLFLMTGLGAVGFVDDFIKIFKQRSLGLRSKAKLAGQSCHHHRLRDPGAALPERDRSDAGATTSRSSTTSLAWPWARCCSWSSATW